jgi:hypothetical protein
LVGEQNSEEIFNFLHCFSYLPIRSGVANLFP